MDQGAPRSLPFDVEMEQALLGSMLFNKKAIDVAAAELSPEHFYDPLHARIFETVVYLSTEGDVEPLTVHAVMRRDPGLIEVGGMAYLAGLLQAAPRGASIRDYCRVMSDLAARRQMISMAEDWMDKSYTIAPGGPDADAIANQVTTGLLGLGSKRAPLLTPYQIAQASAKEVEKIWAGEAPGVTTGFHKLDKKIGGFRPTDFVVIAGKPGMGKSALMGSICLRAALAQVPTLVFSLEMSAKQWVDRMVCDLEYDTAPGGKPLWYANVRNGQFTEPELERFILASRGLEDLPLVIDDQADLNIQQITGRARAFMARHPGKTCLIEVDYTQKIEPADYRENRERQVAGNAMGLKRLAKTTGAVVVAGSQTNEDDQKRSAEASRPRLSDMRESKVIGQEADWAFAPWRPVKAIIDRKPLMADRQSNEFQKWLNEYKANKNKLELLCLKARHGMEFDLELYCEMAASAIRDEEPVFSQTVEQRAQLEMLEGL